MSWVEPRPDAVRIRIHAQPGAKRSEITGLHGDALKVKIQAPPVEGKANEALITFLAAKLGCKRSQIRIVAGETSREKTLEVAGIGETELRERMK